MKLHRAHACEGRLQLRETERRRICAQRSVRGRGSIVAVHVEQLCSRTTVDLKLPLRRASVTVLPDRPCCVLRSDPPSRRRARRRRRSDRWSDESRPALRGSQAFAAANPASILYAESNAIRSAGTATTPVEQSARMTHVDCTVSPALSSCDMDFGTRLDVDCPVPSCGPFHASVTLCQAGGTRSPSVT